MGHPPADRPLNLPPRVVAVVRDLIFASRIRGQGTDVTLVRDPALLAGAPGDRALVDLNLPGALEAAVAWRDAAAAPAGRTLIGFVSHVDRAAIDRARAAGFDQVLARSQFVQVLPKLLAVESAAENE